MQTSTIKFILAIIILQLSAIPHFAQDSLQPDKFKIYKFDIKEEIAPPVWRKTQKAFEEAQNAKADLVFIHIGYEIIQSFTFNIRFIDIFEFIFKKTAHCPAQISHLLGDQFQIHNCMFYLSKLHNLWP